MTVTIASIVAALLLGFDTTRFMAWRRKLVSSLASESKVITTAGGDIEYKIYGEHGEDVLFLHGSPGGFDQYGIHRSEFFKDYRVIAPSRFGYLRTPLGDVESMEDQANAMAMFLDALGVDKVIVSAGSGGGPLALALAAYHPERVRLMLLYATASQAMELSDDRPGVKALKAITRSDFLSWLLLTRLMRKPEQTVRLLVKNPINSDLIIESGKAEQFANAISVAMPPSLRKTGMDNDELMLRSLDIPKARITAPTLIVHGEKDEHVAYEQSEQLHQQLADSRLISIPEGDHFMGYTHAEQIDAAYKEFFDSHRFC